MLPAVLREIQIPVLSALLLGGFAAKLSQVVRSRSLTAALSPTALFPVHLRRPMAVVMYATELILGVGLILTSGRIGRGGPANTVRLGAALLFVVATCALIELRSSKPDVGCGCFGDLSRAPVSGRTMARSALLALAALATVGLPPLQPPDHGLAVILPLSLFAAELAVIAALSPEVGEALVRLGYSEPCELRVVPQARTLAALHRSSAWRRHAHLVSAVEPADVWRELCWRYVTYPAVADGRPAHLVFAVYLRQHRPAVQAALVDSATGTALPWPPGPAGTRIPLPRLGGAEEPARPASGTDPGFGIPAFPGPRFSDLPLSREI